MDFKVVSPFAPQGDQPQAIDKLVMIEALRQRLKHMRGIPRPVLESVEQRTRNVVQSDDRRRRDQEGEILPRG